MGDIFTGSGSYTRNNVEVCLLGLRGDISKARIRNAYIPNAILQYPQKNPHLQQEEETTNDLPKPMSRARLLGHHESTDEEFFAHLEGSSLFSTIGAHSEKPEETYEKIVAIFGDRPRGILFARQRRPGWECFGNEVDKFPPKFHMDPELEAKWKARQDKNAAFADWLVPQVDTLWENRESIEIEMVPRGEESSLLSEEDEEEEEDDEEEDQEDGSDMEEAKPDENQ